MGFRYCGNTCFRFLSPASLTPLVLFISLYPLSEAVITTKQAAKEWNPYFISISSTISDRFILVD